MNFKQNTSNKKKNSQPFYSRVRLVCQNFLSDFIFWFIIAGTVITGVGTYQFAMLVLKEGRLAEARSQDFSGLPPDSPQEKRENPNKTFSQPSEPEINSLESLWVSKYYQNHQLKSYLQFKHTQVFAKNPQRIYVVVDIPLLLPNVAKKMAADVGKSQIQSVCPSPDESLWTMVGNYTDIIIRIQDEQGQSLKDVKCQRVKKS